MVWILKEASVKLFVLALSLLYSSSLFAETFSDKDSLFMNTVTKWFAAWELVSTEVYGVKKFDPVQFVFFDETFVYSTSEITAAGGETVAGPGLFGQKFNWRKKQHLDSLTLPDGRKVEATLMSFASEHKGNLPYFVMPLISVWKNAGVTSKELGLENLLTGVFLHEFSHSQQMKNFGKKITEFEKAHSYPTGFSDDIIQFIFSSNKSYVADFQIEVQLLYDAAENQDWRMMVNKTKNALFYMQLRHNRYFRDSLSHYPSIDRFFLTMEGIGQYSMYAWLTHPKGAGLPKERAIAGVRRGKKQWSQDEGFALFLIMERLAPVKTWSSQMFGNKLVDVITLIKRNLTN